MKNIFFALLLLPFIFACKTIKNQSNPDTVDREPFTPAGIVRPGDFLPTPTQILQADFYSVGQNICIGQKIPFVNRSLTTMPTDSLKFKWYFEGADISESNYENISVRWDKAGIYEVTLIATCMGLQDTARTQIAVNGKPEIANFTTSWSGDTLHLKSQNVANNVGWHFSTHQWSVFYGHEEIVFWGESQDYILWIYNNKPEKIKLVFNNGCGEASVIKID